MLVILTAWQVNPGRFLNPKELVVQHRRAERPVEHQHSEIGNPAEVLDHDRVQRDAFIASALGAIVPKLGASIRPRSDGTGVSLFAHWSGGDEGLALLKKLGNVSSLYVWAPLDEEMVAAFKELPRLKLIRLESIRHTDQDAKELEKSLPGVRIVHAK